METLLDQQELYITPASQKMPISGETPIEHSGAARRSTFPQKFFAPWDSNRYRARTSRTLIPRKRMKGTQRDPLA